MNPPAPSPKFILPTPPLSTDAAVFQNKVTGTRYNVPDTQYLNNGAERIRDKQPRWMVLPQINVKKAAHPANILYVAQQLNKRPEGAKPPALYRDILLSYLGNEAKSALDQADWRVETSEPSTKVLSEDELWDFVDTFVPASTWTMQYCGKPLTDDDFIYHLIEEWFGHDNPTIVKSLIPLLFEKKIPLPVKKLLGKSPKSTESLLRKFTVDRETGIILSLTPEPVAPVTVTEPTVATTEKKS